MRTVGLELVLRQAAAELVEVRTKTGLNLLEQAVPEKLSQAVTELVARIPRGQLLDLLNKTERAPDDRPSIGIIRSSRIICFTLWIGSVTAFDRASRVEEL